MAQREPFVELALDGARDGKEALHALQDDVADGDAGALVGVKTGVEDLLAERGEDGARRQHDRVLAFLAAMEDDGAVDDAPLGRVVEGGAEEGALLDGHEAVGVHQHRVPHERGRAYLGEGELKGSGEKGEHSAGDGIVLRMPWGLGLYLTEIRQQARQVVYIEKGIQDGRLP